jgi:DNA-binding transcriptional regulator YdaS (Cro superfamily)
MSAPSAEIQELVRAAIKAAGGLSKVATHCKVTYQAVQKWRTKLPVERAVDLELLTNGQYPRRQLAPEFPWGDETGQGEAGDE